MESGRTPEAELPLRTLADERKDPSSLFALADYYTSTNRPKDAAAILDKLAATKESHALAKARLAAIDYTAGRGAEAHAILNELLKREPNSRIALVLKGRLLLIEKKPDEALAMARAAISADPERAADAQFLLAQIHLSTGQVEDALDALRQTQARSPGRSARNSQWRVCTRRRGRSCPRLKWPSGGHCAAQRRRAPRAGSRAAGQRGCGSGRARNPFARPPTPELPRPPDADRRTAYGSSRFRGGTSGFHPGVEARPRVIRCTRRTRRTRPGGEGSAVGDRPSRGATERGPGGRGSLVSRGAIIRARRRRTPDRTRVPSPRGPWSGWFSRS